MVDETTGGQETETNTEDKTQTEKVIDNYENLKAANDKVEQELKRGEELRAKMSMGGETVSEPQPEKKELTPQEYVKEVLEGKIGDEKKD